MGVEQDIAIAIADDHTIMRKGFIAFLQAMNPRFKIVMEAGNGRELLGQLEAAALPDVCIVDVNMPIMNGYETVQRITEKYPSVRCLALTIYDQSDFPVLKMVKNGAMGYVTKSASHDELERAIISVYNRQFFFSEDVLKMFPRTGGEDIAAYTRRVLSDEETQLLAMCCSDLSERDMAARLRISDEEFGHRYLRLCAKLNIRSRQGLAMYGLYSGIARFREPLDDY